MSINCNSSIIVAPSSAVAGAATDTQGFWDKTVSVEGTFVATYQVQISLDPANPPAATSWQSEGAALTIAGTLYIQKPSMWVRLNCTAYTSGTATGRVCGAIAS